MILNDAIAKPQPPRGDRAVIRVEFAQEKMCIAAALRQAFSAAANDSSDHDFDQLLRDLH